MFTITGFKNRVQEFVEREKNLQKMKASGRTNHSENSISPLVNQVYTLNLNSKGFVPF